MAIYCYAREKFYFSKFSKTLTKVSGNVALNFLTRPVTSVGHQEGRRVFW